MRVSEPLLRKMRTVTSARTRAVRALRAAQAAYIESDQVRKQAARTVLDLETGYTHAQLAAALGFAGREGLYRLAGEVGGYEFSGDVLEGLRRVAKRYERAVSARRELVRSLRTAPRDERLTFEEMAAAMNMTADGVRYLTRQAGS